MEKCDNQEGVLGKKEKLDKKEEKLGNFYKKWKFRGQI